MATADEYAAWIVKNQDKKGTPDFETVSKAYQEAKAEETAAPSEIPGPRGTPPAWAAEYPQAYQAAIAARKLVGPTVEMLGGLGGVLAGGTAGTFGAGPVGTAVGGIAGAGLGYGIARQGLQAVDVALGLEKPDTTVEDAARRAASNVLEGATYETGGRLIVPVLGPIVKPIVKPVGNVLRSVFRPKQVAVNALREAGGPDLVNALEASRNMQTTPGMPPTIAERALEGGVASPTLAAMERRLPGVNSDINRMVFNVNETRAQAVQNQLARVDQQTQNAVNAMTPPNAANPRMVRDEVVQDMAWEKSVLDAQQKALQGQLPKVSPRGVGEAIISGAERLSEGVRKEIRPLYVESFKLSGDTPIDISNIARKTEEILEQPLSQLDSTTVSDTMRVLKALIPEPVVTRARTPGLPVAVKTDRPIPVATLEQLDAIRKAINNDIAAAKSSAPGMAQRLRNLEQLHRTIDEAVAASKIPQAAKEAYSKAISTYREVYAPRFKEGLPSRLLGESRLGEPQLLPDNVINAALTERGAEQFLNMAQGDRATVNALRVGVADAFRRAIRDPETGAISSSKAAKFLADHESTITALGLKSKLKAVQNEAKSLSDGYTALDKAASNLKRGSATEMIDSWLKSPEDMAQGMARLSAKAKDALRADVAGRVTNLKYLTDNAPSLRVALGKKKFDQLQDLMRWDDAAKQVAKEAPQPVQARVVELTKNFTQEELTSLQRVAEDIKRMQNITKLASQGAASPSPVVGKLGTEALQEAGASATQAPSVLKTTVTVAKNVWGRLEGRINRKAATILADYMYRDPDAALAALKAAQNQISKTSARITGATKGATGVPGLTRQQQEESQ